jgi:hypothetical protein
MADYGKNKRYTRAKVPMQVLRGFSPTEPNKLSSLAPPLDVTPGTDVPIKSGMPIVKRSGTYRGLTGTVGFRNAEAAEATSAEPIYIALHDADAHDVQAAGSLVGLDCSDKFEVQSGYYDPAIAWLLNDPLMVGPDGILTRATVGKFIVGYITAVGTGTNNTIVTGGKTPSATDMKVIQFKTAQNGQVVPAP